ncbi:hypothetical protein [Azonexus sp.]|uniref:hypothetical protein n=1 Tax=Azonexus sp. TaxID=1872668 RepID=UPI0035B1B493
MKRFRALLLCSGLLTLPLCAQAEPESSNLVLSGFGTVGLVHNPNDEHGFVRDIGQNGEPGKNTSFHTDSMLGLQLSYTLSPQWQFIGQVRAREQADNSLANSVSRAFVGYRPDPNLHFRLGRMADATFLMSDYLEVGYAFPWVRPPLESYGFIAMHYYDGLDVTYSLPQAGGVWRLKAMGGRIKATIPQGTPIQDYPLEGKDLWGLALIHEQGPLKVRVGYTSFHLEKESTGALLVEPSLNLLISNPLAGLLFPAAIAEARELRDELQMKGARVSFASAGFAYDNGRWMLQGEVSKLSSETILFPRGEQAYLSAGYRFGNFLPYVMFSGSRAEPLKRVKADWSGIPQGPLLQSWTLRLLNAQRSAQTTTSLGLRWDFHSQAAFKLQWDHVRVRNHGWGLWSPQATSDPAADQVNVLTTTLDFVF